MTLNVERINSFINGLKDNLEKLAELGAMNKEEFLKDYRNYNTALRLLQISIETLVNIGNHIIARKSFRSPSDLGDVLMVLGENDIITEAEATNLREMVKLRNRIVHIYWDIDLNKIHEVLNKELPKFKEFAKKVGIFMQSQKES